VAPPPAHIFTCQVCGFVLYFNPAVSVSVFPEREDGRVLFIRRARDPGKGRLASPGGFVDIGERAEDALHREIREELGIEIRDVRFVCTQSNSYLYREVTYPVVDLFFSACAVDAGRARALEDVESLDWLDPERVDPSDLAFPSMRAAFVMWLTGEK